MTAERLNSLNTNLTPVESYNSKEQMEKEQDLRKLEEEAGLQVGDSVYFNVGNEERAFYEMGGDFLERVGIRLGGRFGTLKVIDLYRGKDNKPHLRLTGMDEKGPAIDLAADGKSGFEIIGGRGYTLNEHLIHPVFYITKI